ncbi:class I SAM-dependent methyltransferase [Nocardioides sp.]|uniref:class I SAM-dependent methyltransferase n=1 Tax=Nocardioides sp. TaxID=35761 RepID=UPI002C549F8B|nr:class I SAM-dependent methyltransferase [Nocardioides sp.]HSX67857.1 class I SAM-dependent methyltransferase [Nocardioides sp.]
MAMKEKTVTSPEARLEEARAYYARELGDGVERFVGAPYDACPWCGSADFGLRIVCRDIRQFKPGTFRLDECRDCGHVFQNPPQTDEGLTFYYRDTYDGLSAERTEASLETMGPIYRSRAETIARIRPDTPRRWLDVGTASGHFPAAAKEVFPETAFDGLDMSDGVLNGVAAGRIEKGHQGQFPDLSGELAGQYDQISMFHYLEHVRDPFADLDAVVETLSDDGWFLIEQPDPHARSAKLFGSWWPGWNQPEHLHMITEPNLVRALEERGMEVVEVVHREAHIPAEAFIIVMTLLNRLAPTIEMPWLSEQRRPGRLRRLLAKLVIAPLVPLAMFLDKTFLPKVLKSYHAYRIVARKVPRAAEHPAGPGAAATSTPDASSASPDPNGS